MQEENALRRDVDQFILEEIDSVPHLEALLLLWNRRPRVWSVSELAHQLYISSDQTSDIVRDLQARGLVTCDAGQCTYDETWPHPELMEAVDRFWRRELIRISSLIHSKASPSVRQFASAFRFKRQNPAEKEPKKD
jgi:DNA-binding IclR family transcriptional regulator